MKKMLVKIASALSAAAILTLAGCSQTPDFNVSSEIDTVLNLAKPEVNVTAYPGMNYVSWTPVANANGYVLYIYEDGNHIKTQNSIAYSTLNYTDTAIQKDKTYKYIVEAVSKTSTGRAVVTENSLSNPVSVKAIVPDYETSPLELFNFESGKNAEYVVSAANINAYKDADSTIAVSFPSKAYLNYDVYYSLDNEYETYRNKTAITSSSLSDKASNNGTLQASATITSAGTYHFIVDAKAVNSKYGKTDTVVSDKTVEVETLAGSGAQITSAKYRDDDTIRVVFTGFNFSLDGSVAPAEYYKVYRSVNYNPSVAPTNSNFKKPTLYTPVSGTVKASDISSTSFFVEDEIEDNTVAYTYTLVVTDGTRFATLNNNMRKIVNARVVESTFGTTRIQPTATCLDNDDYDNDIEWTITLPDTGITINDVYYLEKDSTEGHTVVAADFVKDAEHKVAFTAAGNTTGSVYKVFTKDHTPGTDVYLLVSISKEGYKDAEVVSTVCTVAKHQYYNPTFTLLLYDNKVDGSTKADYEPENNDVVLNIKQSFYDEQIDEFEFEIYETTPASIVSANTITWDFETADWKLGDANTELKKVGLKKNAYKDDQALNEYCAVIELSNLNPGLYAWKLVKTNKATGKVVYTSPIRTAVINGVAGDSIKFVPDITVEKENPIEPLSNIKITFIKSRKSYKEIIPENGPLAGYVTQVIPETPEKDVTYTLYRTILVGDANTTKVVWTKLGKIDSYTATDSKSVTTWVLDANNQPVEEKTNTYTTALTYTYTDNNQLTGDGYTYVVVCEKEGCETKYSNPRGLTPIN